MAKTSHPSLEIHIEWFFHALVDSSEWIYYETEPCCTTVMHLLDVLDEHAVKAEFYILGVIAMQEPQLIESIHRRGHRLGSHGWGHALYECQGDELDMQTRRFLPECIGYRPPYWYGSRRPGYAGGAYFRLLPYPLVKMALEHSLVLYLHPHDLDLHPGMLRRSFSIGDPWQKLHRLLGEHTWHDPR